MHGWHAGRQLDRDHRGDGDAGRMKRASMIMHTGVPDSSRGTAPRRDARIAGTFYLLNIVTILLSIGLKRGIVVAGNPAATAANFIVSLPRFQAAWALEVISTACSLVVAAYIYRLFVPVSKALSLLATLFRVVACSVAMIGYLLQAAPLPILTSASFVSGLSLTQLQAAAYIALRLGVQASNLVIVVFGFHAIVLGYLVYRSTFIPRAIGVLLGLAGVGGCLMLVPLVAGGFFPVILATGAAAELSLTAWLLFAGIDVGRWLQQADRAAASA
jgi:hypothetical protein